MNFLSRPILGVFVGVGGEEWKEANAKLEDKKQQLSNQIELRWGFEAIRGKLNDFEERKIWRTYEEAERQEEVYRQLHTISEEEEEGKPKISPKYKGIGDIEQFWKRWGPDQSSRATGN